MVLRGASGGNYLMCWHVTQEPQEVADSEAMGIVRVWVMVSGVDERSVGATDV